MSYKPPIFPQLSDEDHRPSRSYVNLDRNIRMSVSPGTVNVFDVADILPGDNLHFAMSARLESFPMNAPLLDRYRVRNLSCFDPITNYYGYLDNNTKITSESFFEDMNYFRAIPLCLGTTAKVNTPLFTPVTVSSTVDNRLIPYFPKSASSPNLYTSASTASVLRPGVGPGTVLNHIGLPIGFCVPAAVGSGNAKYYGTFGSAYLSDVTTFIDLARNSGLTSFPTTSLLRGRETSVVNLHRLFAYMNIYRSYLVNSQSNYAYYTSLTTNATADEVLVENTREFHPGYRVITLKSLDAFFMGLRAFTASPKFAPNGKPIRMCLNDVFELNDQATAVNPTAASLIPFLFDYMLRYIGLTPDYLDSNALTKEQQSILSALWYVVEVLGLHYLFAPQVGDNDISGDFTYDARIDETGHSLSWSKFPDLVCATLDTLWSTTTPTAERIRQEICVSTMAPALPNSGLFLGTFGMDLNRALLDANSNRKATVALSGSSSSPVVTIDAFRVSNAIQRVADRFSITDGRFASWISSFWRRRATSYTDTPELLHVTSAYITSKDVVAVAGPSGPSSGQSDQASLAQQAGYTIGSYGSRADKFVSNMYGTLMTLCYIEPEVTYSQGVEPALRRINIQDEYLPQYANISFEDVPFAELYSQDAFASAATIEVSNPSRIVGRRPQFQDLRTRVPRAVGRFGLGGDLSYWTLGRRYVPLQTIPAPDPIVNGTHILTNSNPAQIYRAYPTQSSNSTYIFPDQYNYLFTQTDPTAMNLRIVGVAELHGTRSVAEPALPSIK